MSNRVRLTIGVATYNRKELAIKRLREFANQSFPDDVEILFVDNCSEDGTYDALSKEETNKSIVIYKNAKNLGFAGNFIEVIRKARGEYVLWSSDEDSIDVNALPGFLEWLSICEPDAVVCDYSMYKNGQMKRYRKNKRRVIRPAEYNAFSHLPGIVWKKNACSEVLEKWEELKSNYPYIGAYYPQMFLCGYILPLKNCYFWDGILFYQVDYFEHQHIKKGNDQYYFLCSRWRQKLDFNDYLDELKKKDSISEEFEDGVAELQSSMKEDVFESLRRGVALEAPDVLPEFDRGVSRFCKRKTRLFRLCRVLLRPRVFAFAGMRRALSVLSDIKNRNRS